MKQIALVSLLSLIVLYANAYDVKIDGIYYNLVKKAKVAEVTYDSSNPYSGPITIPSNFDYDGVNYTVKTITSVCNQYSGNDAITSVKIPISVETIGDRAFYKCSKLTSIEFPDSLKSIGDRAFYGCASISSISFPFSLRELGEYAFAECSGLKTASLPDGIMTVPPYVLYNCKNLESLTIGRFSFFIGKYAFSGCSSLQTAQLPEFIMIVGASAFYSCSSLEKVILPKDLLELLSDSFANCPELIDVYCYSEKVPTANSSVFSNSKINYATLHVPSVSLSSYKSANIWKGFGSIVALTDEESAVSDITANELKILNVGHFITIRGAKDNDRIAVYDISGRLVGSGIVRNNTATIPINIIGNNMVIVKIGNKPFKVILK